VPSQWVCRPLQRICSEMLKRAGRGSKQQRASDIFSTKCISLTVSSLIVPVLIIRKAQAVEDYTMLSCHYSVTRWLCS
jgi:hypothetical protein